MVELSCNRMSMFDSIYSKQKFCRQEREIERERERENERIRWKRQKETWKKS